jgi:lipopolysaccharide export system permease protein
MKKIERYIFIHLFQSTLFVLGALVLLLVFMQLSREISQVGQGDYGINTLILYTLYTLPSYAYEMFPFSVLIGVLIAMTQFVHTSEYAVMRTIGMSLVQIGKILLIFGAVCGAVVFVLGEYVTPEAKQKADRIRMIAKNDSIVSLENLSGIWAKDRDRFIRIGEMLPDGDLIDVHIYHFRESAKLFSSIFAGKAHYDVRTKQWVLSDVLESYVHQNSVQAKRTTQVIWNTSLHPDVLSSLVVAPEQMSSFSLLKYIDHLSKNNQKTQRYELAMWSKWLYPISCVVLSWIALAFVPSLRRSGALAKRIIIGVVFGLVYYFLNRFVMHLGLLYHWSAPLCAILPVFVFSSIGIWGIWRQELR